MHETDSKILARLIEASRSFRKGSGRHVLKTQDVVYCAFSTPALSVDENVSQRSARMRIKKFNLPAELYAGSDVLDLGAHCGAMLFELQKLGIRRGVGVEFDTEKVDVAAEIAEASKFKNLIFKEGDIDSLRSGDIGRFDIVLALAIEGHVKDRERLFDLLADVTQKILIFEGNGGCDTVEVADQLYRRGFVLYADLGFCDDDVRPENNRRPVLIFEQNHTGNSG